MKLKVIKDSNPVMRMRSKEVLLPLSAEDQKTLDDMLEYLKLSQDEEYAKKHNIRAGVGLAAIQINVLKRMFVVYIEAEDGVFQYQMVNPKIVETSVKLAALEGGEGCLSVDNDHKGLVHRFNKIRIKGYDAITKQDVDLVLTGYLAIVMQHEYDHLDGKFYYDHIDKMNPDKQKPNEIIY